MIGKLIIATPQRALVDQFPPRRALDAQPGKGRVGAPILILSEATLAQDIGALFVGADVELIDATVRAWEHNSRRAFVADIKAWAIWCRLKGRGLAHADERLVAAWIRSLSGKDMALMGERSAATIERYLVSVGRLYRLVGMDDPTKGELVRVEHRAARKEIGVRQRQARAIRFKGDVEDLDSPASGLSIQALLKACHLKKDRKELALRDEALLRVAVDTGFRRSELVAIIVSHIEGPNDKGAGRVFVPKSKTDAEGEGDYAYLSPRTMVAIEAWKSGVNITKGSLFRRVRYHPGKDQGFDCVGNGALHPDSVSQIYKRLVREAGTAGLLGEVSKQQLDRMVAEVSGHSIRVGVAQDNVAAGESLISIMQAYRWKDARMVKRYADKLAVGSGAAARMAKRFEV